MSKTHFITLRDGFVGFAMPSKVYGCIAFGPEHPLRRQLRLRRSSSVQLVDVDDPGGVSAVLEGIGTSANAPTAVAKLRLSNKASARHMHAARPDQASAAPDASSGAAEANITERTFRVAIVTSIHADFDARIWKHATSVAAAGHEVHLVCPWAIAPGEVREGVVFHPFPRTGRRLQRAWQIPARVLPRVLKLAPRVDLIHFHDFDLLPLLAPLAAYRPVVYDVHENYPEEMLFKEWLANPLRRPLSFMTKWGQFGLARLVGNVVLVVPSQEAAFPSRAIRRVHVPNYASRRLVDGANDDYERRPDAVIFTGLQYESNGSTLLLNVAELLRATSPQVRFLVSDNFPQPEHEFRQRYLEQIHRRRLNRTIKLLPRVPAQQLMTLLNRATIGINLTLRMPRHEMGLPTKLFEYMAAGLPVVTSDLARPREIIEHSRAGLLAQPEDPATFVQAIKTLVDDRTYAWELGQNGRRAMLEHYSWESQMPKLLAFYDEILA